MTPDTISSVIDDTVYQLSRVIASVKDANQVVSVLQWAVDALLNGSNIEQADDNIQQVVHSFSPLEPLIKTGQITQQNLRDAFYSGPFLELSEALLAYVAPDFLSQFSPEQVHSLSDIWFNLAPAHCLLQALIAHLAAVQPTSNSSRSIARALSTEIVARFLVDRFCSKTGLVEVCEYIEREAEKDDNKGLVLVDKYAGLMVVVADYSAAFYEVDALQPKNWIHYVVTTITNECSRSSQHRETIIKFAAEVLGRFSKRGHAKFAAEAVWELAQQPGQRAANARIIRSLSDSAALERLVEALIKNNMVFSSSIDSSNQDTAPSQQQVSSLLAILPPSTWEQRSDLRFFLTETILLHKTIPSSSLSILIEYLTYMSSKDSGSTAGNVLLEAAWRLAETWATKAVLQTLPLQQQAYMTTALEHCIQNLAKNVFEKHDKLMPAVLKGVGVHLDSPLPAIRRQGMRVGFTMSKLLDPSSPGLFHEEDLGLLPDEVWDAAASGKETNSRVKSRKNKKESNSKETARKRTSGGKKHTVPRNGDENNDGPLTETDSDDNLGGISDISSSDGDSEFEAYDLDESDEEDPTKSDMQLRDIISSLQKAENDWKAQLKALRTAETLIRAHPDELEHWAVPVMKALLYTTVPKWSDEEGKPGEGSFEKQRFMAVVSALTEVPEQCGVALAGELYSPSLDTHRRAMVLEGLAAAAQELATPGTVLQPLPGLESSRTVDTLNHQQSTAGSSSRQVGRVVWRANKSLAQGSSTFDRHQKQMHVNRFLPVALQWAAALLKECDVQRHGINLFGRDHFLLGKLVITLGSFVEASAKSPQSAPLAAAVLELIRGKGVYDCPEPCVRRAALLASSQVLLALPPSLLASSLLIDASNSNNKSITSVDPRDAALLERLDWLQSWTDTVVQNDPDGNCRQMAEGCRKLHAGLAGEALTSMNESEGPSSILGGGSTRGDDQLRAPQVILPSRKLDNEGGFGEINIQLPGGISSLKLE